MKSQFPVFAHGIVVRFDEIKDELKRRLVDDGKIGADDEVAKDEFDAAAIIEDFMRIDTDETYGKFLKVSNTSLADYRFYDDLPLKVDDVYGMLLLDESPSLFRAAYKSHSEAIDSLIEDYGSFLPSDFDYEGRFCCYIGTVTY